jgi:hypothetical protein
MKALLARVDARRRKRTRSRESMKSNSVNDHTFQVRAGLRDWTRHRGIIALSILVIGVGALLGWAAVWRGTTGVRWALLAISICGFAGLVSLVACRFVRGPQAPLWVMLIGMGIRMTAALAACLVVNSLWRDGIHAGFGWYLVVAYLLTLAVDILYLAHPDNQDCNASANVHGVRSFGDARIVPTQGERHG